ncbi:TetR/AcrR family transcriptional regulator [Granulicoccus phenolivorans]|uniref:TetR/AcrR family transcriptional regulator n=1 Tax=Granulicoccus phenolivorans TaxID=266854 RepID=UPI00041796C9|nr:TetR family transcriptional regulator [Granulicoccus phenolivorans]
MALTKDRVLGTALEIVDSYGLGDLSMRRLAGALGVQPGALYYHVANKQTLLIELADLILADPIPTTPQQAGEQPGDWLREWGLGLHRQLRAHRCGAELVSAALAMRPAGESPARPVLERLTHGGLSAEDAAAVAAGALHLVIGHSLDAEQRAQYAELGHDCGAEDPEAAERRLDAALGMLARGAGC